VKVIDMFCGIGGFSEGAKQAGFELVFAANHWDKACEFHDANHPEIKASCQDVRQLDWRTVPQFDGFLASPACQGHSKAKGKEQPHHDALRMTAWAVIDGMEYHRPAFGVVENVPEFMDWDLYPMWVAALNKLGYAVSPHVLDAADFGVPQNRERVFIVITKSKAPLKLKLDKQPHVAVDTIIDWGYKKWAAIHATSHVPATLARIASGRAKFGDRFIAPFYGTGSGETGRSIHRPVGTVTTKDRWLVVDGNRCRVFQPHENLAAMGFPADTVLPSAKYLATFMLGNSVAPAVPKAVLPALVAQL
jgi:DNA (cytosine-5)-methyltransferase 1